MADYETLDREGMREKAEDKFWVSDTRVCGPGIIVESSEKPPSTVTGLTKIRSWGWYAAAHFGTRDRDYWVLMPDGEDE